ncbi:hypothetical protein RYX36_031000 [Vicia faba]
MQVEQQSGVDSETVAAAEVGSSQGLEFVEQQHHHQQQQVSMPMYNLPPNLMHNVMLCIQIYSTGFLDSYAQVE